MLSDLLIATKGDPSSHYNVGRPVFSRGSPTLTEQPTVDVTPRQRSSGRVIRMIAAQTLDEIRATSCSGRSIPCLVRRYLRFHLSMAIVDVRSLPEPEAHHEACGNCGHNRSDYD